MDFSIYANYINLVGSIYQFLCVLSELYLIYQFLKSIGISDYDNGFIYFFLWFFQFLLCLVWKIFIVVKFLSHVWLFVTPWTAAHLASLSFIISQSLLKLRSIELMMSSNHLVLWCPFLLLPSIFPNIGISSNELAYCIRWPNYWGFFKYGY